MKHLLLFEMKKHAEGMPHRLKQVSPIEICMGKSIQAVKDWHIALQSWYTALMLIKQLASLHAILLSQPRTSCFSKCIALTNIL